MPEPFDVNAYWLKRGRRYIDEPLPKAYHQLQEDLLLKVLREGGLSMRRLLELGCGFGRITRRLGAAFPSAEITAVDLSPDQLANAHRYCAGLGNIQFRPYDFYADQALPGDHWDTVIAVEVFLHHPAILLRSLFDRLSAKAEFIVNIDWSEPWPWATPEHVWVHDFAALYREAGLQAAAFLLPEKVDGLQHRLFVAGRRLPPELLQLEESLAAEARTRAAAHPPAGGASEALPPAAEWLQKLHRAAADIREAVPAGSALVLVNNDAWGCEPTLLAGYRVWPFLEFDGSYWGPPADDAEAIRELDRMRAAGARYLVFAWNAFWWLEHYREFHRHLQARFRPLRATAHVAIFAL